MHAHASGQNHSLQLTDVPLAKKYFKGFFFWFKDEYIEWITQDWLLGYIFFGTSMKYCVQFYSVKIRNLENISKFYLCELMSPDAFSVKLNRKMTCLLKWVVYLNVILRKSADKFSTRPKCRNNYYNDQA